jgi:hypothetical protein
MAAGALLAWRDVLSPNPALLGHERSAQV